MAGVAGAGGGANLSSSPPTLSICRHFNAPTGCRRPDCRALHVCFYFVTSQCRFGVRCRLPHTLEDERTAALLLLLGVPAARREPLQLLTELRRQYSAGAGPPRAPVLAAAAGGGGGAAAAAAVAGGGGGGGAGAWCDRLPSVCLHYNGSGCLDTDCRSLHLCYLFAMDRCRRVRCSRTHSLTSVHNARLLQLSGARGGGRSSSSTRRGGGRSSSSTRLLDRLRREAAEQPARPSVCRRYCSRDGCPSGDCLRLHCCFYFARGDCAYGDRCRLEHRLSSAHNRRVLQFFDLTPTEALCAVREELCDTAGSAPAVLPLSAASGPGRDAAALPVTSPAADTGRLQAITQAAIAGQLQAIARAADTVRLQNERRQLEQTLQTVAQLSLRTEEELANTRRAGLVLQAEAEHVSLVAQERERELTARQTSLLAERDSLERSLLVTAEGSDQLEDVVTGLNAQLSALEQSFLQSQQEQQRLAAALEQERRLQRDQQEQREQELERTLVCSVCLEMFVRATTLGCSHTFCRDCVLSVQRQQGAGALCPMCRAPIRTQTASITLDQMVERAVITMSREKRDARQAVLRERQTREQL